MCPHICALVSSSVNVSISRAGGGGEREGGPGVRSRVSYAYACGSAYVMFGSLPHPPVTGLRVSHPHSLFLLG